MADISATLTEILRLREFVYGAARFVASQNTRATGLMELSAKLADGPVLPRLNPQPIAINQDSALLSESASVTLDPVQAGPADSLKLSDSVSAVMLVLGAAPTDYIKVADAAQAALIFDLTVSAALDSAKLADTVTASLNPNQVTLTVEGARLADTVFAGLTPLRATASEALALDDSEFFSLDRYPPSVLQASEVNTRRYYVGGMMSGAQAQQNTPE